MKIRVFALPGGQLQIFVDEGSFAEAEAATRTLFDQLRVGGLPVEQTGQIEQHRDDVTHVHVQAEVNAEQ